MGSPKSVGFILCEPWKSNVLNFMAVRQMGVELLQSAPKWWTEQEPMDRCCYLKMINIWKKQMNILYVLMDFFIAKKAYWTCGANSKTKLHNHNQIMYNQLWTWGFVGSWESGTVDCLTCLVNHFYQSSEYSEYHHWFCLKVEWVLNTLWLFCL